MHKPPDTDAVVGRSGNCEEFKQIMRMLVEKHFSEADEAELERLAKRVIEMVGSAEFAQEMIPARPDVEISWITGRSNYTRDTDVKRLGVNNEQEDSSDGNGRGDGTDGDDGRGATNGSRT